MEDRSDVIFVNSVAVSGFGNGVTNLAFSTCRYTPLIEENGKTSVVSNEYISANLRMDLYCVQQLHDTLASILAQQVKPATKEMN